MGIRIRIRKIKRFPYCSVGGPSRGRASWRGGTESYRERGHPDDEWQTARGSRRSYHDNEDVRWGSSYDRLPEWSNDDNEDFTTPGTFDSSGAFVSKVACYVFSIFKKVFFILFNFLSAFTIVYAVCCTVLLWEVTC